MIYEFDTTCQTGCVIGKPWHLSFIRPFEWTSPDSMKFYNEIVTVQAGGEDYKVHIEYALLTIDRPWFYNSLFSIPFRHSNFGRGKISDEAGSGFLPIINTGIIVARKIEIEGYYENDDYQIIGWIVKKIPLCPQS